MRRTRFPARCEICQRPIRGNGAPTSFCSPRCEAIARLPAVLLPAPWPTPWPRPRLLDPPEVRWPVVVWPAPPPPVVRYGDDDDDDGPVPETYAERECVCCGTTLPPQRRGRPRLRCDRCRYEPLPDNWDRPLMGDDDDELDRIDEELGLEPRPWD